MNPTNDKLLIFDGHNVIFRAYHALIKHEQVLKNKNGDGTWGIYGFFATLAHFVNRLQPNKLVITFDWGQSEKRLLLLPEYKGNRKFNNQEEANKRQELSRQIEVLIQLLEIFNIKVLREPNVEADDIIAKIVKQNNCEIVVVSADHDLRQLVTDKVIIVKPSIGIKEEDIYDYQKVIDTYGIEPSRLSEVWALTGDVSDNIPGIPGIGEKTAVKLLQKYGTLENVLLSEEKNIAMYRSVVNIAYRTIHLDGSYCSIQIPDLNFDPIKPGQSGADFVLDFLDLLDFNSVKNKWIVGQLWSNNELSVGKLFKAQ